MIVTSLASGSSGNALLIRANSGALLVDAGVAQRTLERWLAREGLTPSDLTAIILTHEHGDHAGCAGPLARRHRIPIGLNQATAAALASELTDAVLFDLPTGATRSIGPFVITSFSITHDAADPVGFLIEADGWSVGVATDLGCWNERVATALQPADLIVLESNHDREKLRQAPYAWPIKQRIASERGHLDNVDAGRLLATIAADGRKRTAWLAHLSHEANTPEIAVRVVRGLLAMASICCVQVAALPRRTPLTWSSDSAAEQTSLFDSQFS
jgi:phosphoribosyl 1,2-cyclic phosphodiesterase